MEPTTFVVALVLGIAVGLAMGLAIGRTRGARENDEKSVLLASDASAAKARMEETARLEGAGA